MFYYQHLQFPTFRSVFRVLRLNSRKYTLSRVKQDGFYLLTDDIPEAFKDDEEIMLEAVRSRITVLAEASHRLRDSGDFIAQVLLLPSAKHLHPPLLSNRLLDHKGLAMKMLLADPLNLTYLSPRLKADQDIVFFAMKLNLEAYFLSSKEFQSRFSFYEATKCLDILGMKEDLEKILWKNKEPKKRRE